MLSFDLFPAAGRTESSEFYETGMARLVSKTASTIQIRAKILSGDFEGQFEVVTLVGQFDLQANVGTIDRWVSRIAGEPHYRLTFDEPIRLQNLGADLEQAAQSGIRFAGNGFANTFNGDIGNDIIRGMAGNDRLRGLDGHDRLEGHAGRDTLVGGNGADRLAGGVGNDGLVGGNGRDILSGGPGRDLVAGGSGPDSLFGGAGADLFRFTSRADSGVRPAARDTIRDFASGQDVIDLSAIDARPRTPANDAFDFVDGAFSGTPGEVRLNGQFLDVNLNATRAPEMRIAFAGDFQVLESDLLL